MGMAASQARLLTLQARMSNVEYMGQQINQERAILSQQVSDLYNSLLTMTVPTPPSTQEFTKVEYSGLMGTNSFTLGNIVPTGSNSYSVDLNFTKVGHYMDKGATAQAIDKPEKYNLAPASFSDLNTPVSYAVTPSSQGISTQPAEGDEIMTYVGTVSELRGTTDSNGDPIRLTDIKNSNGQSVKNNLFIEKDGVLSPITLSAILAMSNTNEQGLKIFVKSAYSSNGSTSYTPETFNYYNSTTQIGTSSADNLNDYNLNSTTPMYARASAFYGFFAVNGNSATRIHAGNITDFVDENGVWNSRYTLYKLGTENDQPFDNTEFTNTNIKAQVAGRDCYTLKYAADPNGGNLITSEETLKDYITAIKNARPEFAEKEDDEIMEMFGVYTTLNENGTYDTHFVLLSDIQSSVTNVSGVRYIDTYNYIANGTYTEAQTKPGCRLTFDGSGRITEIEIPIEGNAEDRTALYKKYKVSAATVTDDAAYQDAYNKYEYAQHLYDQEVARINAKTELIQREDKNLELKLSKQDTERNALKTEIEAVGNVLKTAVEQGFKTFNG